jgi:hypothetical protein
MRDIIWTIIGVWFVYKIYTEVISPLLNRQRASTQTNYHQNTTANNSADKKDTKKQNLDGLGDYVDYEEIKD